MSQFHVQQEYWTPSTHSDGFHGLAIRHGCDGIGGVSVNRLHAGVRARRSNEVNRVYLVASPRRRRNWYWLEQQWSNIFRQNGPLNVADGCWESENGCILQVILWWTRDSGAIYPIKVVSNLKYRARDTSRQEGKIWSDVKPTLLSTVNMMDTMDKLFNVANHNPPIQIHMGHRREF